MFVPGAYVVPASSVKSPPIVRLLLLAFSAPDVRLRSCRTVTGVLILTTDTPLALLTVRLNSGAVECIE